MISTKIIILLACSLAITMARKASNPVEIKGALLEKLQKEFKLSLNNMAARGAPHYEISKINSAYTQLTGDYDCLDKNCGELIKMNVDLVDTYGNERNCDVSIWLRTYLIIYDPFPYETTLKCAGQKVLRESHQEGFP